ncbi:MAG TPA: hypothetical protein VKK79_25900, partial [Candidatus Lokiarchaeia archaeon]|nr:hypothetical protein [Candidatus Lokiarchaeia archaeon]
DEIKQILGEDWNELGYHRTIGGFFYTIGLLVPSTLIALLFLPFISYTSVRYPEISGLQTAGGAVFGILYGLAGLNMDAIQDRFIPQYLITDPRKAMQYASFYIKYQIWSGLVQLTLVAIITQGYIISSTIFAYLAWYVLIDSIGKYTGFFGTFTNIINEFQRYNLSNLTVFYRTTFIDPVVQLAGGVLGLFWGQANPIFGEVYGMLIGFLLAGFASGAFQFVVGSYYLSKILKQYGMRLRELFGMKVPRDVWVSSVKFAARFWPSTFFGTAVGFASFLVQVTNLPGYLTINGLIKMAQSLARFAGWSSGILGQSQQVISESYNNGKYNLCRYYIASGLKYWTFFWFFLGLLNIFLMPIILQVVVTSGILNSQWLGVGPMVPILVFIGILDPFNTIGDRQIKISNHPEVLSILNIIGTCMGFFFTWYFLAVLHMGWLGMILIGVPFTILSVIVKLTFMNAKLLPLPWSFWKDIGWQVFVAPMIAGAVFTIFGQIILQLVWPIVSQGLTGFAMIGAAAAVMAILVGGLLVLYIPVYSWFGGWDDHTMRDFRKSVPLTGFSLFIVLPMYRLFDYFYRKSPFKKQAKMNIGDIAFAELLELGRERTTHITAPLND